MSRPDRFVQRSQGFRANAKGSTGLPYNRVTRMFATLDEIVTSARRRVIQRRTKERVHELQRRAGSHAPRGFRRALADRSKDGVAIIAELKKASPSKGLIRSNFDVRALAPELESSG